MCAIICKVDSHKFNSAHNGGVFRTDYALVITCTNIQMSRLISFQCKVLRSNL